MADHTQSINESINCFGPGPSTKWGTAANDVYVMTWGTDKWGEGSEDLHQNVEKVLSESESTTDAFLELQTTKLLSESQASSDNNTEITNQLGSYYWEFISQVTDADDRQVTSWTAGVDPTAGFSTVSDPSTTWS